MPRAFACALCLGLMAIAPVSVVAQTATATAATPPGARSVAISNPLYEFAYAYPAAAGVIPRVKAILDQDLARARSALTTESRSDRAEAKKAGFPYRAHATQIRWSVVTSLPGWLSLSAEIYSFTGGAHGNSGFDTLLWDKRAKLRRKPIDLFVSADAFRKAIEVPFCAALDRERAKKRGPDFPVSDMFSNCIDPVKEAVVILGSGDGRRLTRVGFLIGPYSAGPYAEGTYEVTLPVTPALLRAVRPQFRDAFAIG